MGLSQQALTALEVIASFLYPPRWKLTSIQAEVDDREFISSLNRLPVARIMRNGE